MDFQNNSQLKLAHDFVQFTGRNVFLTGKAGTGKTTFLHNLKQNSSKRIVVVAPTGVAAINASGVTIHSFFQLSFGPQIPEYTVARNTTDEKANIKRFSREKINIIKSMDLLIIDEVSMVRSDLLDGIDAVLRRFRNRSMPFGGVQLLMIGDLQQLAPVVKEDEWSLLRKHYDTPFFFSSNALKKTHYVTIELKLVYRQKDEKFIKLLNKIRDNKMDQEVIATLNQRYHPDFDFNKPGYIILTTHNAKAKSINDTRMRKLTGKAHKFQAEVKGVFPEYTYPTEFDLQLKKGAQVMFVKNDPEPEKLFYNGKIGTVVDITNDAVKVQCEGDEEVINVVPLEWQKVKYTLDETSKEISESIEGTFMQLPLKLAWAITIHKSQGLTFDKVVIDAQAAFAHGQVYVALSRCTSLEGIMLSSKIMPTSVKHDSIVDRFTKDFEENQPDTDELEKSKQDYQRQLLFDLFDFQTMQRRIYYAIKLTREHSASLQINLNEMFSSISNKVKIEIADVSDKFRQQLTFLLSQEPNVEKNSALQERIGKAAIYFSGKVKELLLDRADDWIVETDNKAVQKLILDSIKRILQEINFKYTCLQSCRNGLIVEQYISDRAKAAIEEPAIKRSKKRSSRQISADVKHPELYQRLKDWRDAKAAELKWEHLYMVMPLKTMRELSNKLPLTMPALTTIKGLGKKKLLMFGGELIEIITDYCDEKDFLPEPIIIPEKKPKKSTKQISFEMWQDGKSVEEIASERGFVKSTIERHLSHYVETGDIPVEKMVLPEKVAFIKDYFTAHPDSTLSEAKEALGEDVSWTDLHFVKAYLVSLE